MSPRRTTIQALAGVGLVAALFGGAVFPASAATATGLDLGTAADFGVLAGSAVTNTGTSDITGDLGIWPGTAITGFNGVPPMISGTIHPGDTAAQQAQADTATAYTVAENLTPTSPSTVITQLAGRKLTPGVYAGDAIELSAKSVLTLDGSAASMWVFKAKSSLIIGSGAQIQITGGASACNVFWQVGSSATIGSNADFAGTVLARTAITVNSQATIAGRLLARDAAVTLDTDTIITPSGCSPRTTAPAITSGDPPAATVGSAYSHTVTASGTPVPSFTVSAGALPAGLDLNGTTGLISGTPTAAATSNFSISAGNGTAPNATAVYTVITGAAAGATPGTGTGTTPGTGTGTTPGTTVPPVTGTTPGTTVPPVTAPPATTVPPVTVPPVTQVPPVIVPPGVPELPGMPSRPQAPAPDPTGDPQFPETGDPATPSAGDAQVKVVRAQTVLAETGMNPAPAVLAGGLMLLAGFGTVAALGIRRRQEPTRSRVRV